MPPGLLILNEDFYFGTVNSYPSFNPQTWNQPTYPSLFPVIIWSRDHQTILSRLSSLPFPHLPNPSSGFELGEARTVPRIDAPSSAGSSGLVRHLIR